MSQEYINRCYDCQVWILNQSHAEGRDYRRVQNPTNCLCDECPKCGVFYFYARCSGNEEVEGGACDCGHDAIEVVDS